MKVAIKPIRPVHPVKALIIKQDVTSPQKSALTSPVSPVITVTKNEIENRG